MAYGWKKKLRLSELKPRWYVLSDNVRHGFTFECPHCHALLLSQYKETKSVDMNIERIGVAFHHSGYEAMEDTIIHVLSPSTNHIWGMTGDSFENLTLTPSVDASAIGHWHGRIVNGEII